MPTRMNDLVAKVVQVSCAVSILLLLNCSLVYANSRAVPSVLDLLLNAEEVISSPNGPIFGAAVPAESARPSRTWLTTFDGLSVSPIVGSLQATIDSCPLAGCVIEIDQLQLTETVFINRSNLKLIGATGNLVTYTATDAIFLIESGTQNIVIEGLNIDGRINGLASERDPSIFGVYIFGDAISNVLVKDNHIHHLDGKEGAHGIGVLGTGDSDQNAIFNIIIEGNELNDLRTGFSESLVVNGNVRNWEIIANSVTDVNNIAIDAIGGEGTSPTRTVAGRVLPGLYDAARFGFIENNNVTRMSTLTNPAYGSEHTFAGGIYIDGARDILIRGNTIVDAPWAFEIGAENCIETSNITVDNNDAEGSRFGDLLIGGYAMTGFLADTTINCDPLTSNDNLEGHGYTRFNTIKNNRFNSTGVLRFVIEATMRVLNTVIVQSGVDAVNIDGNVSGDENSIRTSE